MSFISADGPGRSPQNYVVGTGAYVTDSRTRDRGARQMK